MPFIGNRPADSFTSFAKQDFTTSATTSYTLDYPVANENEIALFINFVRQEPTTAYSASGTTLTLTSATSATDDMYAVFLGKALQTVNPSAGSVGTSQLADGAVTSAKLASGAVANTPALSVVRSSGQSIPNTTVTKVQLNSVVIDTASAFDNVTNYRFTIPSGQDGIYNVSWQIGADEWTAVKFISLLYKNGSTFAESENFNSSNSTMHTGRSLIMDLNVGDYLELFVYHNSGSTKTIRGGSVYHTYLNAYKIIE